MKTKIFWLLILAALVIYLAWWGRHLDLILFWFKAWAGDIRGLIMAHPILSWAGWVVMGALMINFPIPMAAVLKVLSGYMFGLGWGMGANFCASTAGAALGFLGARHLFRQTLYRRHGRHLAKANLEIVHNGFWYILSCRLFLVMPFFLVNILAGLSTMRLRKFLVATMLGVVPSSMIYAVSGHQLDKITCAADLMSPKLALVLVLLGLAAAAPAVVKHLRGNKTPG